MDKNKLTTISNNFFNPKLFIQALKQLKTIGITTLVCVTLFTVIAPILRYAELSNWGDLNQAVELADIIEFWSPLFILLYIIVPLMSIVIFRFLSSRKGSDFYHSLPVKRTCIYITFVSAVVTWAFIIIFWYTLVFTIMLNIFAVDLLIDVSVAITFSINILIGCLLMATIFGISCSISGTLLTNVITSVLILLVPSIIITFITQLGTSYYNAFASTDTISVWLDPYSNIVLAPIFESLDFHYSYIFFQKALTSFSFSTIYTLLLSVAYLFVGALAFKKRPSESAGKAFSHNIFSYIYIFFIGYMISFINVAIFYEELQEDYFEVYLINIIIYILMATIMFICEMINSKSFKRGFKVFITSPIIIVLDVITILLISFTSNFTDADKLDAKDIDYIYLYADENFTFSSSLYPDSLIGDMYKDMDYQNYDEYYNPTASNGYRYNHFYHGSSTNTSIVLSSVKITDPEIISYVVGIYNNQVEISEKYGDRIYEKLPNDSLLVTYDDMFTDTTCTLYLSSDEITTLFEKLANYKPFAECLRKNIEIDSDVVISCDDLTNEQAKNVYKLLCEEYAQLDFKNYLSFMTMWSTTNSTNYVSKIEVMEYNDGIRSYQDLPITSITPEAYSLFLKYYNANNINELELAVDILGSQNNYEISFEVGFTKITKNGLLTQNDNKHYIIPTTISNKNQTSFEKSAFEQIIKLCATTDFDKINDYLYGDYYLCYASLSADKSRPMEAQVDDYVYTDCYFIVPSDSYFLNLIANIGKLHNDY